MSNVLLLRTATQDSPDQYEDAFRSRGYHPISVPELARILSLGPEKQNLSGVIITSKRAVEAWSEAALIIADNNSPPKPESDWWPVPFYAVGEATSDALRDICKKAPLIILKDHSSGGTGRKLLYLTGDRNRDTLPRILESGGVALDPLQVYATQGSSMFSSRVVACLGTYQRKVFCSLRFAPPLIFLTGEVLPWGWIIYFAPSVAEFVTPILRNHFVLPTVNSIIEDCGKISGHRHRVKVAAIGPTTEFFLQQTLKLLVAIAARNPNAGDLVDAVLQYDEAR
ncbi:tetrapyrrole biosynthesis, uroporphyrinogen III synthase [Suillus paluster]|uniref:tetrapyrrole biosynthesis, uroporphyrinogen III synthase n=1 Tax=Suillus paluster TaxID=48578 RepID=UPI001B876970|nr:tetrapyrrole biosynthesis, uroporphyrinogen III synthase [Suillus paluster]KAG1746570.1 tetrapyrrole biosynthesis, uroporphyrinogen III synthase [Suillus paluster]